VSWPCECDSRTDEAAGSEPGLGNGGIWAGADGCAEIRA
jgi:hypothetical protein